MIIDDQRGTGDFKSTAKMPWQDRPEGCSDIVWRYDGNPVVPGDLTKYSSGICNSAVVPYKDGFAGVFSVHDRSRNLALYVGGSKDGINFELDDEPIGFISDDKEVLETLEAYDPRVCFIDDRYYVTWCNNYHGYTIGAAYTFDFKEFYQMENAFLPYNRNGVLFPRKINDKFYMFSRPSDTGHTPFGDMFISQSPDFVHWGCHRFVMGPKANKVAWDNTKVGAGPVPIETKEGWLKFYHGVINTCNGFNYSMGAVLLDIDKPWKVLYRAKPYLLAPLKDYERVGNTPNVVFPVSAICDAKTGKIAIYYGSADTAISLAFCQVDEVIDYVKANSEL